MFQTKNLNPTGKKKSDCVVRAIMAVTNQSWEKVYDDLCIIGKEKFNMPNSKEVYEEYLRTLGWEKMPMPKIWFGEIYKRYTVDKFIKHFKKDAIVSIAKHLTAIVDGKLSDTWDCGYKSVGNYWIKQN